MPLSAAEFAAKWSKVATTERATAQSHFNDLCELLDVPKPHDVDPLGEWYAFERGASKTSGGDGWADVWKRGHFGWEYKGKHHDLNAALRQLIDYKDDLENPPLLVVSDMDRIEVHTNFTNTKPATYTVTLDDLATDPAEGLRILRAVMSNPDELRPKQTPDEVTQAAASRFALIARSLQDRGHEPEAVAHFLNRVLFCLFAEDVGLLPRRIMTELIESRASDPAKFTEGLAELFALMSSKGGYFGNAPIEWFNGGLFDGAPVIPFTRDELRSVRDVSRLDWSQVEPAILGTLFERGLDPEKRGQLGAHYTDREKILMVVEPVVMQPLRREFEAMRDRVEAIIAGRALSPVTQRGARRTALPAWEREAEATWRAFVDRLRAVRVLDPACGSGNFLYVTLRLLKDLEQQAIHWGAERLGLPREFPEVGPHNLLGIEINPYAKELASVSIWVGHIQWMLDNGYGYPRNPVLQPLHNIEQRDAILARDAEGRPVPAEWPAAEFIVGNPPFLGDKVMRSGLGDEYVEMLRRTYAGRVPGGADLVVYWHEVAREQIANGATKRAGLLATQSIRRGANRQVFDRIKETGDIFLGWSDEPWVVEGAAVRVAIVGQDDGTELARTLNGKTVGAIQSDLSDGGGTALTTARALIENVRRSFIGDQKSGAFDIDPSVGREMLSAHGNPNGRPNSDVVRPWVNGADVTGRPRGRFIIDFGNELSEVEAASYEAPFEYVARAVKDARLASRGARRQWWLHERPRPEMRSAIEQLPRFAVTPRVAKYRLWVWFTAPTLPDSRCAVVARSDDWTFGVLQSRVHEVWSLRTGGWHGVGNDPQYTPSLSFETFPFPWPLNMPDDALTSEQREHRDAVGAAARALDEARNRWLNPPEWVRQEPDVIPSLPPRLVPVDENAAKELAKRTLTNLYNARPAWLDHLHRDLDAAVFAAYSWAEAPDALDDETMLARLLALNLERGAGQAAPPAK